MLAKEILTQIDGVIIYRNFIENLPYNPHLKPLIKEKIRYFIRSLVLDTGSKQKFS